MGQATKSINATMNASVAAEKGLNWRQLSISGYLPAILPLIGAAIITTARVKLGASAVPTDGTLIILGQLCYITAAASLVTNFWAPVGFLQRLGLWTASLGFFFNLSSWLVRWVTMGDRENWVRMTNQITGEYHPTWFFSYIPFANLYDLSVAFAFGAAFATLLISHRENTRFIGAISLPLISLILLMATFIGNSFIDLPPVLDSYWRPIHVGVASMSYGVALVSFALAVVYLLKDGVKTEAMGVAVTAFFVVGFVLVWLTSGIKAFDPFTLGFRLNPVVIHDRGMMITGARVALPGVGPLFALSMLLLIAMTVCFLLYLQRDHERARRLGHLLSRAALVMMAVTIGAVFYQVNHMGAVGSLVGNDQAYQAGLQALGSKEAARQTAENIATIGVNFLGQYRDSMVLNIRSNPVEMAALFTIFAATLFVALFNFRTEKLRASLPSLEKIDSLTYKLVGVAFAGLAILLVTGAVWANESWGRYWGWDSKETGALVAWLSYAGYLHTRIAHNWSGRRSAYFALVGFLLVIFTYLGVSYILPGLHSYA
ncbi:MAG TPA: cytochrome c biogenesis protein CcsA [Blastocatellia bacterium]|nr:cytochrome c biogenesis protein CcsA [Blastocatellia bacterium]